MGYVYLSIAIVAEVIGTSALKASQEFTRLGPSLLVIGGYGVAFYALSLVLKTIPVGIAYAIWAGTGTVVIAVIGIAYFKEPLTAIKVICTLLVILGVVGLKLSSPE